MGTIGDQTRLNGLWFNSVSITKQKKKCWENRIRAQQWLRETDFYSLLSTEDSIRTQTSLGLPELCTGWSQHLIPLYTVYCLTLPFFPPGVLGCPQKDWGMWRSKVKWLLLSHLLSSTELGGLYPASAAGTRNIKEQALELISGLGVWKDWLCTDRALHSWLLSKAGQNTGRERGHQTQLSSFPGSQFGKTKQWRASYTRDSTQPSWFSV